MVQMAASLGLDSCETNPVLLRKMARWKQDKHRQRVQEARTKKKGADGRSAAPSKKVGVPFGRSGFKQDKPQLGADKLPPVDRRAHHDLNESMGDLDRSLDELRPMLPQQAMEHSGRTTPERAMDQYYEANPPSSDERETRERKPRQASNQRRQQQQQPRERKPPSVTDRPAFDCTPLESDVIAHSASGLKVRREVATREPARAPKHRRAMEDVELFDRDRNEMGTPSSDGNGSAGSSPAQAPVDSAALLEAQRTIAQLRKHLHAEKSNTTARVEEATKAAKEKTSKLDAALAQTKTQLRMLQKQLQKAREEAACAQEAAEVAATAAAAARPVSREAPSSLASTIRLTFERVTVRPRSEQRSRDASTPPSRIPEPRPLRTPTARSRPLTVEVQSPAVPPQRAAAAQQEERFEETVQAVDDEADEETVFTPTTAPVRASRRRAAEPGASAAIPIIAPPEVVGESPDLLSARGDAEQEEEQEQPVLNTDVEEDAEEDIVRLERGLSTSASCSFCVTGSPPMAEDETELDPPEVDLGEEATSGEEEVKALVGTDEAGVVAAADRALDGVARVLDAIDDAADDIRTSGAADTEAEAGSNEPPPFWETELCGPPAPTTSSEEVVDQEAEVVGQEEEGGEEEQYSDDDEDVEELPVAVISR